MKRFLIPLLLLAAAAHAQTEDNEKAPAVVQVSSVRDPELKSYRTLLKAYTVFEEFRSLAPNADLRFLLLAPPSAPSKELSLRISDGEHDSVGVAVAADNTFELPRVPALDNDAAELLLNVKKGQARWRPLVTTPGLAPGTRRLGDLRLECEIRWVVEKNELSLFRRTVFAAEGGPCHSRIVSVHFIVPRALASATLVDGERRRELTVANNGYTFVPPLQDKSFSNETLVQFVYKDASK